MSWVETVPAVLACIAWFLLLGVPITYALGLRGIAAWAIAPVISVVLIAGTAIAAAMAGIGWSVLLPIVVCAVVTVVVAAGAFLLRNRWEVVREREPRSVAIAALAGLLPAFVFGAITIVRGIGSPENLSQTYDALFHYNAIALIMDVHNASSLSISSFGLEGAGSFYPAAWHDLASLVVMTTGTTIPVAANVLAAVIAIVVWPLSCVFLARQLFGRSPGALAVTGVLSLGFNACPWGLLGFGVLWPNALGMAIAPAALAVIVSLTGLAKDDAIGKGRAWLLLPVVFIGTTFAHPGVMFSLVVLAIFPAGQALLGRAWRLHKDGATLRGAGEVVGVLAVLGAIWYWTATTSNPTFAAVRSIVWAPFETPSRAAGEVLLNATNGREALWLLSAVMVVGFVWCLRTVELRWVVAAYAATAFLYVLTASLNRPDTIKFTGYWYNDSYRLAAMLPVTAVPLATGGILFLTKKITERLRASEEDGSPTWVRRIADHRMIGSATGVAVVLVVVLAALSGGMYQSDRTERLARPYLHPVPTDVLTSPGQRAFFAKIKSEIPEGSIVANNPWDGSGMLWAIADRRTLFPHFTAPQSAQQTYLAQHLNEAASNAKVCGYARDLHVDYLLIGDATFWPWDARGDEYPGLTDPGWKPGFELVDSDGGRKLYKITACATEQPSQPGVG